MRWLIAVFLLGTSVPFLADSPLAADEPNSIPVIAIADFDGPDAQMARAITQTFTVDLAASPKVRLVERAKMDTARQEIGLGATGMIDPSTAPQLGKELGADKVIIGSFAFVGSVMQISARMVDVETNSIVGGVAANVTGDIAGSKSDVFGLAHQLASRFYRALTGEDLPTLTTGGLPSGTQAAAQKIDPAIAGAFQKIAGGIDPVSEIKNAPFKVTVDVDRGYGATYKFGDHLTITFSSERDCYLRLYDIDSQRQVTPLYPNRWEPGGMLKAGETHTFPPQGARWKLSLEGVPGEEIILAVATKEPTDFKEAEGAQEFIGKSVAPRLKGQDKATWATSEVRFYTEEPRGSGLQLGKYVYLPYPPYSKTLKGTDYGSGKAVGDSPYSLYEQGAEKHLLRHLDEAQMLLKRALALDENFLAARIALATVQFDLGEQAEARGRNVAALEYYGKAANGFEAAIDTFQNDPELHFSCGAAYAAICLLQEQPGGDATAAGEAAAKAADMLDRCLALAPSGEVAEKARALREAILPEAPSASPVSPAEYPYIPAASASQ